MILDTRSSDATLPTQCDVLVIGGGPAGITLALELAPTKKRILLLESGGLEFDHYAHALSRGEASGTLLGRASEYLQGSRLRYLGGATNHWGGICRPLDAIDFEKRDWVPHSGWPVARRDLDPYYSRAAPMCDVRDFKDVEEPPSEVAGFDRALFRNGPPTRFGQKFRERLREASNVTVCLHAHALKLSLDDKSVKSVRVKTAHGETNVAAGTVVLAAGGIENPRLLMLSRERELAAEDPLGRYFMDHPHVAAARVLFFGLPRDWLEYTKYDSRHERPMFRLNDDEQRKGRALNGTFSISPLREGMNGWWHSVTHGGFPNRELPEDLGEIKKAYETRLARSAPLESLWRELGLLRDKKPYQGILFARTEQAPNPDSRITFGETTDPNGQRVAKLEWKLGDLDRASLVAATERFGREIAKSGRGRLEILFPKDGWPVAGGGYHLMGTTRMSDDPRTGVVDKNQRVHGMENLYVTGSSVFPTSGCSNPTLTLVALTLRLAEHLGAKA